MQLSNNNNNNKEKDKDDLMNFKVLSRYDDLFTDIFLDNLFLWFNTIKMNNDHRRPRVPNTKILDIIQRNILEKARPMDAVSELLAMDYFRHYLTDKSQKQVQEFVQHMKRYLFMYMPNAGYEVGDTRRYGGNGRRVEACLIATKDWHAGDEMRLLTGMIACLDPKDDAELKRGNRDFSVMWSTRKNCSCLFLGPARFANHDCDSNCKFISLGQNSITFKVLKDIKYGEEITVYYGKHYFGENNCECKCITCEKLGMGYFASLETKENTPIDAKEEEQGGTRRSTRKRKSALHEDYAQVFPSTSTRRAKRASIEPSPKPNSLEDLIGEENNNNNKMELDTLVKIKKEPTPPMPISPTTATTEKMAKLRVMSINFLCGSDEETSPAPKERRVSDCPLLDLLVDAAMDAEYMNLEKQQKAAQEAKKEGGQGQITVVVNPQIHRDATQRMLLQQQPHLLKSSDQPRSRNSNESPTQPDSPQSSLLDSSESKADSAVSLSPRLQTTHIKKEQVEDGYWRREIDDGLFNNEDDFDDFLDNMSDLSSVCSTELSTWTTEEEEEEEVSEDDSSVAAEPVKPKKKSSSPSTTLNELTCIACSRTLTKQDISEQVGADMSITNELATWTWSPSAIFTDWRPKRCPRCERHYTLFRQEWPNRKIKKKKQPQQPQPQSQILEKLNGKNSKKSKKKRKKTTTTTPLKKSTLSSPIVEPAPSTPVYQMQDDPDDLNYIPPSPLSEIGYEEEDDAF